MSETENISLMFKTKLGDTLYVDVASSKDTEKIIGERMSLEEIFIGVRSKEEILSSIEEDVKKQDYSDCGLIRIFPK
ncbi:MAG: hypothetical protein PHX34_04860 [Candidatus Shapirobacteria bacterium]|nr:hypothetical protein [Candidatus Shapirobacteria bacterium]